MTKHAQQFEQSVTRRLRSLARRIRLYVLADGLATVLVIVAAFVVSQLAIDRFFRLAWDMRAVLLAVGVGGIGFFTWRHIIHPTRRPVSLTAVALLIERTFPNLGDRLISALQFVDPTAALPAGSVASSAMIDEVVAQADASASSLRFDSALNHRRAAQRSSIALACVVGFGAAWLFAPQAMGIWFHRNVLLSRQVEWPQLTQLEVQGLVDGRLIHAAGDDLTINMTAVGVVPSSVEVEYEPQGDADDASMRSGELQAVRIGERTFRTVFPQLRQPLRARAAGGDAVTPWFDVVLVERPRLVEARMSITPPAYTRLERQELRTGQTVAEALRGSAVTLDARINKPVADAQLWAGESPSLLSVERAGDDRLSATFTPSESSSYSFRLTDENGLTNRRPVRFTVRVVADRPPRMDLRIPGLGEMVTGDATLPISIETSDTYGLGRAELVHRAVSATADAVEPTPAPADETAVVLEGFETGSRNFSTSLDFPLRPLELQPGQRFSIWSRAADQDDVNGPNVGESTVYSLRVVTADELLAELSRREREYRREFERLVRDQEHLRGALLSTLNRAQTAGDESSRAEVRKAYAAHERREQALARRVLGIRGQFQSILDEMAINAVATQSVRLRLEHRIIEPLEALGRRQMADAADRLGAVSRDPAGSDLAAIDPEQAQLVEHMQRILSEMLQWEGFHEAVSILRDIIQTQSGLNRETEEELERRIREIFGTNRDSGASNP